MKASKTEKTSKQNKINPEIFREYDIRGIADKDLTNNIVEKIAKAYGTYVQEHNKKGTVDIVVGRDNRLSSERIENALIKGILSTGCNVIGIGVAPTPILYYAIHHYKKDGGVMVTGSHNPIEFNGLKLCLGADSIYGKEIQKLRAMVERNKKEEKKKKEGKLTTKNPIEPYLNEIKEKIKLKRKLKIVIDAGNGTAGMIVPKLFSSLGCEVVPLYCNLDGRFPNHLPDPTVPELMQDLMQKAKEEKADIGLGYDGDGDRIGTVDEKGKMIFSDKLLALFSKEFLLKNPGEKIIFDVKCSDALPEFIKKYGGKPIMWKTGHSLIKAKMKKEKALFAGEASGHINFADEWYGFDDAVYASARLLQFLSSSNKNFSELMSEVPSYYSTPVIRSYCSDKDKFDIVEKVREHFKKTYKVIEIDGAKIMFENIGGWALVRASNTQPAIVLAFEAKTKEGLKEIKSIVAKKLREFNITFV